MVLDFQIYLAGRGERRKGAPFLIGTATSSPFLPSSIRLPPEDREFFSTVSSPPPTPPKKRFLKLRPRRGRRSPLKLLTRLVDDVDAAGGRSGCKWRREVINQGL